MTVLPNKQCSGHHKVREKEKTREHLEKTLGESYVDTGQQVSNTSVGR